MRVFKFGGAAVSNAERIDNLASILKKEGTLGLTLIVSAMGKTTNKVEKIVRLFLDGGDYLEDFARLQADFEREAEQLFSPDHFIFGELNTCFVEMKSKLMEVRTKSYNFIYDQVVSYGELITSKVVAAYLEEQGLKNTLLDARDYIKTDAIHRDATVDWAVTAQNIQQLLGREEFFITQGFISGDREGYTTTLGREGSDYSAAIFAYCLGATELVIWKDVIGVLNADPRYFDETTLLEQVSFSEAIELAYYGASIIHPKTIQPLYSKGIPLKVRSFIDTLSKGTLISEGQHLVPDVPCYILKKHQQLLQVSSKDFSFIVENDISAIFKILHQSQMKVNLLHNSAISLSLCIDDRLGDINECVNTLKERYKVLNFNDVTLYTVRNFNELDFKKRFGTPSPLLKQTKDDVVQIIIKEKNED